eukprot:CAMPEP_0194299274 /NCGR_PEP_ID=MMETSP0169-20130528/60633_1 /TAXON_ID=218684 /ORGANISM="Corethron pennatum, Strain L29A3" /LENGTH=348 /DNA_ID=CAMNT_0039049357 /DNA_START=128 /DNA_END=1171 /DNA_ORIENTATION=-
MRTDPWQYPKETATKRRILRKHFHMVGWEYTKFPKRGPLGNTDWESPNIVSVIIMRDPLSRLLSGGAYFKRHYKYKNTDHFKQKDWVSYSQSEQTDNYALRILTGERGCCDGKDTDRKYLQTAKDLIRRMTYVLDIDCLEEGMKQIAEELGINMNIIPKDADENHVHKTPKERIKYVYQDLKEKNHLDIELYEWSQVLGPGGLCFLVASRKHELGKSQDRVSDHHAGSPVKAASGGPYFKKNYGYNTDRFKQNDWVTYSQSNQTDNYALRILTGNPGCCDGKDTNREYLETAKDLLRRMTYILDIDCLGEGMKRMAVELGITMRIIPKNADKNHVHKSPKERIKYVYQ